MVINAQDGFTSVTMIFVAYVTDHYIGRFQAIMYTTLAFIAGLVLLWVANPTSNTGLYILMAALLAVGQAGEDPPLSAFLEDHVRRNRNSTYSDPNNDRVEARTKLWWGIPHFAGALVAMFVAYLKWERIFAISVIVMGSSLLFFLFGYCFYHPKQVTGSRITTILRVFRNAIKRRGVAYSYDPRRYYKNYCNDELPLMPNIYLFSRWLDKAAIIEDSLSPLSLIDQEERGQLNTVTEVKEVKRLLTMVPMWATFFMYCVVLATGNTFFFEQTTNLQYYRIQRLNFTVPDTSLYAAQKLSYLATAFLSNLIVNKRRFKNNILTAMKARIALGLAFSCLCCIVARMVEIKRLGMLKEIKEPDEIVNVSVFWLLPQFCSLGIAQGLAEDGLSQFFYNQVPKSMHGFRSSFNELALGIGKFISIFWILTFKSWIRNSINESYLEKYYGVVAISSIGNLVIVYGFVSRYWYKSSYDEDAILQIVQQEVGEQNEQL